MGQAEIREHGLRVPGDCNQTRSMSRGTHQREYWSFYWPLTIMGLALLLSNQFQNGILSRYPDAAQELTNFALAGAFYAFLHAALAFVPQMSNVYGRSRTAVFSCLRFSARAGVGLALPLLVLGWSPLGPWLSQAIFGVGDESAAVMQLYFRLLAPVIFFDAVRHALTGLLVQARRTGWVTILNLTFLAVVLGLLLLGFRAGRPAVWTVGVAQLGGGFLALIVTWIVWRTTYRYPRAQGPAPEQRELWRYFWPVMVTSICFALSRPVIFFFASRTPEAVVLIAALRVAFDFSLLFFNPVNQFRHLLVTFGMGDGAAIRRFILTVIAILSGALVITAVTPLGEMVFRRIFGLEGAVLEYASAALLPLALVPWAIGLRNWFHGIALIRKTTRRMGAAAIARIGIITLCAWFMLATGWLGPRTGALLLAFGFLAEAAAMWAITRWITRDGGDPDGPAPDGGPRRPPAPAAQSAVAGTER